MRNFPTSQSRSYGFDSVMDLEKDIFRLAEFITIKLNEKLHTFSMTSEGDGAIGSPKSMPFWRAL